MSGDRRVEEPTGWATLQAWTRRAAQEAGAWRDQAGRDMRAAWDRTVQAAQVTFGEGQPAQPPAIVGAPSEHSSGRGSPLPTVETAAPVTRAEAQEALGGSSSGGEVSPQLVHPTRDRPRIQGRRPPTRQPSAGQPRLTAANLALLGEPPPALVPQGPASARSHSSHHSGSTQPSGSGRLFADEERRSEGRDLPADFAVLFDPAAPDFELRTQASSVASLGVNDEPGVEPMVSPQPQPVATSPQLSGTSSGSSVGMLGPFTMPHDVEDPAAAAALLAELGVAGEEEDLDDGGPVATSTTAAMSRSEGGSIAGSSVGSGYHAASESGVPVGRATIEGSDDEDGASQTDSVPSQMADAYYEALHDAASDADSVLDYNTEVVEHEEPRTIGWYVKPGNWGIQAKEFGHQVFRTNYFNAKEYMPGDPIPAEAVMVDWEASMDALPDWYDNSHRITGDQEIGYYILDREGNFLDNDGNRIVKDRSGIIGWGYQTTRRDWNDYTSAIKNAWKGLDETNCWSPIKTLAKVAIIAGTILVGTALAIFTAIKAVLFALATVGLGILYLLRALWPYLLGAAAIAAGLGMAGIGPLAMLAANGISWGAVGGGIATGFSAFSAAVGGDAMAGILMGLGATIIASLALMISNARAASKLDKRVDGVREAIRKREKSASELRQEIRALIRRHEEAVEDDELQSLAIEIQAKQELLRQTEANEAAFLHGLERLSPTSAARPVVKPQDLKAYEMMEEVASQSSYAAAYPAAQRV